jgi:predicted nucleic acid-binding protein
MIVVADSSPLIALCRIGRLHLLHQLFGQLLIPDAVWTELTGSETGKIGTSEILSAAWIERRSVIDESLVDLLRQDLGAGESEAIVLAREIRADVLLMDERRGRNAAKRLGLTCTGLVGVLMEARRQGIVSDPAVIAQTLRDSAGFWISDELMALLR